MNSSKPSDVIVLIPENCNSDAEPTPTPTPWLLQARFWPLILLIVIILIRSDHARYRFEANEHSLAVAKNSLNDM